jgi:DNA polymerase-3 subunit gamma/tau
MYLLEYLQNEFNNRSIAFEVLVDASEQEEVPVHLRLNSRQKFERIADQFPIVRELKDRLKMDIDY